MWKLIKMDFYRLFTSKTIKVGALMACLVCGGYMLLSLGVVELGKYAMDTDPSMIPSISFLLSQVAWVEGVNFSEIVFAASAAFALFIGCMITSGFIGSEQACGYAKNYAGQLHNKGYMAISKFVVTSLAQAMVLLIYVAVSAVLAMVLFGRYITGYDISTLVAALGLRLVLHLAINAIIIFICTLTKSHAIAMVVGCIFGIGVTRFVYMAASMLLSVAKINFPIGDYMPDGINSALSLDAVGEMTGKAILVSVAFIVVFMAANVIVLRKRDVK